MQIRTKESTKQKKKFNDFVAFEINVNHRKKKKKSHCIAWQP